MASAARILASAGWEDDEDIDAALDGIQGTVGNAVFYTAGDFTSSTVAFTVCMESQSLIDAGTANTAVVYDSTNGGLQPLQAAC